MDGQPAEEVLTTSRTGSGRRPTGSGRKTSRANREVAAILDEVVAELRRSLGSELLQVRLFGSRARGDAQPDSDVDLLVIVRERTADVEDALGQVVYDVMWRHEFRFLLSPALLDETSYRRMHERDYSFLRNVESEGIDLWKATPAA